MLINIYLENSNKYNKIVIVS